MPVSGLREILSAHSTGVNRNPRPRDAAKAHGVGNGLGLAEVDLLPVVLAGELSLSLPLGMTLTAHSSIPSNAATSSRYRSVQ